MKHTSTRPTPDQITWLKENYRLYNNDHLAVKLGVGVNRIICWLKLLDLRKRKPGRKIRFVALKKKRVEPGPEKKIKHPPADHTNLSREQHIERILNMEI